MQPNEIPPSVAAVLLELLVLLPKLKEQASVAELDVGLGFDSLQAAPDRLRAQAALMRENLDLHTRVIAKYEELATAIEESLDGG